MSDMSRKLKQLREETKLTQKQFSKKYNIPLRTLENWETGTSNIKPYTYEWLKTFVERDMKNNGK